MVCFRAPPSKPSGSKPTSFQADVLADVPVGSPAGEREVRANERGRLPAGNRPRVRSLEGRLV
jgi:hypothetical protein